MRTIVFTTMLVLLLGAGCAKREPPPAPPPFEQPTAAPSPDAATPTAPPTAADAVPTVPPPAAPVQEAKPPNGSTATTAPASADGSSEATPITPREILVTATQWTFDPTEIRLQKGVPVVLVVTSTDVNHGLLIPALNVNEKLTPGNMVRIAITPTTTGTFPMICNVFCGAGHKDMRGVIIVE